MQSLHTRVWRMRIVPTSCHSWQKISAKSRWKGLDSKIWLIDQKECRSTNTYGRWHKALADGLRGWPTSYPQNRNTSPWSTTKHKIDKLRDPKARRVAETFGNSKWTRAWMIIECSNDDVQVLRTVKKWVSTYLRRNLITTRLQKPQGSNRPHI